MMVSSLMVLSMAMGSTVGTADVTRVSGQTIKCMAKEFSSGTTAVHTLASMSTTKRKALVISSGVMAEYFRVIGNPAMHTVLGYTPMPRVKRKLACGTLVSTEAGWRRFQ